MAPNREEVLIPDRHLSRNVSEIVQRIRQFEYKKDFKAMKLYKPVERLEGEHF